MAHHFTEGSNRRKAGSRKAAKAKSRIAAGIRRQRPSITDLREQLGRYAAELTAAREQTKEVLQMLDLRSRELAESLQHQTVTSQILNVISDSKADIQPVFDAVVGSAARLFEPCAVTITFLKDDQLHWIANAATLPDFDIERVKAIYPIPFDPERSPPARALLERRIIEIPDATAPDTPEFTRKAAATGGFRSAVFVPLIKRDRGIGTIVLTHMQAGFKLSEKQLALVKTFADEAVIAIENANLFEQVQKRTHDLSKSLEELRATQDRLVQTEKLASLGQLTAGIAHEIKNPLNFVNNFSALSAELVDEMSELLQEAGLNEERREELYEIRDLLKSNLEKVVQHGKRADSIVKNMLLHSRSGSGERWPVEINAVVDESLNLAYHGARAERQDFNITLERDFDPLAGSVEIYPQEITRVFLNLISNGIYAATKRAAEAGRNFEPRLKAATRDLGDQVEVRILDNGMGIPSELKEKIFNPFFTTKPAGEGTGLGLSISHDIVVKQHGGRIVVTTEPGAFTEFILTLPRTLSAPAA